MQRTRQQLAAWGRWLAHLHTLLGGLAAEACSSIAATRPVGAADVSCSSADCSSSNGTDSTAAGISDTGTAEGQVTGAAGEAADLVESSRPGSAGRGSAAGGSSSRHSSPPKKTTPRGSRAPTPRGKEGRDKAAADTLLSNNAIMLQLGLQVGRRHARYLSCPPQPLLLCAYAAPLLSLLCAVPRANAILSFC